MPLFYRPQTLIPPCLITRGTGSNYMLETITGEYDKLPNNLRELALGSLAMAVENYYNE